MSVYNTCQVSLNKNLVMKKTILLLVILAALSLSFTSAQNKVEKYCQVEVNRKVRISVGNYKELFALKDTSEYEKLRFVSKLTSAADVLNYMSKLGWTVVNIYAAGLYTATEILYFKKEYNIAELHEDLPQ
jgi:hypothetical protein